MSKKIIRLGKDQIDWQFVNIRDKHGEESYELWQSLQTHGQLQPGAGWWQGNGKFRILYGHRRAIVLTTHGLEFEAILVPEEDEINSIEKQLIENEQRLRLKPGEEEAAIQALRDFYGDESIVAKRIGRSKTWIHQKIRANANRESITEFISNSQNCKFTLSKEDIDSVPTSIIDKTMDSGITAKERAEVLEIASNEKGGITTKNINKAIHKKKIQEAGRNDLMIILANKEAELLILSEEKKRLEFKIQKISTEIKELKGRIY